MSGKGKVYSYVIIHRVISNSEYFKKMVPYAVVSVELEEGIRVYGLYVGEVSSLSVGKEVKFKPYSIPWGVIPAFESLA